MPRRTAHQPGKALAARLRACAQTWAGCVALASLACGKADASPGAGGPSATPAEDASVPDAAPTDAGEVCGSSDTVTASDAPLGPPLTIEALQGIAVPVRDEAGGSGIEGLAVLTQSQLGGDGPATTPAELSVRDGKLCLKGTTVIVPLMSFAEYWGAAITFFLAVDSVQRTGGADAGGGEAAGPIEDFRAIRWDPAPANAVGVSFVVEGRDADLPCAGVPPLVRVQVLPSGSDPNADLYCRDFPALGSGQRVDLRFAEATRDCWEPGGRAIFAEPLPADQGREIVTVTWLIPADEQSPHPFDLCLGDLRLILGQ